MTTSRCGPRRSRQPSPPTVKPVIGRSPSSPRSARPRRRPSIRSSRSPPSPNARACGSMSTRRTPGSSALIPERRGPFAGWERADSIVVNPHKWLFTPLDASLLLTRRMDRLRAAFSLVPEYLRTLDRDAPVRDYNEYQPQLGRRFRALKLWIQLRWFGLEGLRRRIERHIDDGQRRSPAGSTRRPTGSVSRPCRSRPSASAGTRARAWARQSSTSATPRSWTP